MTVRIRSFAELSREVSRVSRNVMDDTALTLTGGSYGCHIHRERIDSSGKVLHWLRHVGDKQWATKADLLDIIDYAKRYNGVDPYAENG